MAFLADRQQRMSGRVVARCARRWGGLAALGFLCGLLLVVGTAGCHCQPRYRDFAGAIRLVHPLHEQKDRVFLVLRDRRTRAPLEGVRIAIESSSGAVEMVSDDNGIIEFPLTAELYDENPVVTKDYDGRLRMEWVWAFQGRSHRSGKKAPQEVTPEGMERITGGDFTVWYSQGCRREAETASRIVAEQADLFRNLTGLEPLRMWGVIIMPTAAEGVSYFTAPFRRASRMSCYAVEHVANGRFACVNMHEWTELTLDLKLDLYGADRSNRFIGDGLAEYAAFVSTGTCIPCAESIMALKDAGIEQVDLLRDFRAARFSMEDVAAIGPAAPLEWAAYGLSFVFWHDLCEAHGEDLPRRFLLTLSERKNRSSASCIKLLEELTGERGIAKRLREASIDHALRVLESLDSGVPAQAASPS